MKHAPVLRIPMRGYEIVYAYGLFPQASRLRIPMRGYELACCRHHAADDVRYESPCGVMSFLRVAIFTNNKQVTNPHAGL